MLIFSLRGFSFLCRGYRPLMGKAVEDAKGERRIPENLEIFIVSRSSMLFDTIAEVIERFHLI